MNTPARDGVLDPASTRPEAARWTALCENAYEQGRGIDLSGCHFEPDFIAKYKEQFSRLDARWQLRQPWRGLIKAMMPVLSPWLRDPKVRHHVQEYYYFLAGLVATERCYQVLEMGTYYGGSSLAMLRGLEVLGNGRPRKLVTVDLHVFRPSMLRPHPLLRRVKGDTTSPATTRRVVEEFEPPIDLMYLDAAHDYEIVRREIDVYGNLLRPRFLVLDDIHLCESMRRLWSDLMAEHGDLAYDATLPARRLASAGFGVIRWRPD